MAEAARRAQEGPTPAPAGQAQIPEERPGQEGSAAGPALRRAQSPRVGGSRHSLAGLDGRRERRHRDQCPPPRTGASAGCSRRCWSRPRWPWSRPLPWPSFWAHIRMSSPRFTSAGTAVPSGHTTSPKQGPSGPARGRSKATRSRGSVPEHGHDGNRTASLVAQSVNGRIRPAGDGVGHRFPERGWGDRGSLRRPGRSDILSIADHVPGDGAAAVWFAALRAGLRHHRCRHLGDADL